VGDAGVVGGVLRAGRLWVCGFVVVDVGEGWREMVG